MRLGLIFTTLILVGCTQTSGPLSGNRSNDSVFGPQGRISNVASQDGLAIGHALMARGDYDKAITAYLRAAADEGLSLDVLSALGSANLKLGRLGQAEKLLRQALEKDETFVPALNNLGVVLMEQGRTGEASLVFKSAFAQDSGNSDEIRENLRRSLAILENSSYSPEKNNDAFELVRRGNGRFVILKTPDP